MDSGKIDFCEEASTKFYMVERVDSSLQKKVVYGLCSNHDLSKDDFTDSYEIKKASAEDIDVYLVLSE